MANESFKKMLQLAKEADKIVSEGQNKITRRENNILTEPITAENYDEKIAELNEQVYGKYKKPENEYNAEEEMEKIKSRNEQNIKINPNTKIPSAILEDILRNPYQMDVNIVEDPKMSMLEEKLKSKNFSGIEKAQEIQKKIEEKAQEKLIEKKTQNNQIQQQNFNGNPTVDYSIIKMIVENVIEEKFEKISKTLLTEGMNNNPKKTSFIMLGENFTFVDSEGNMYKCGEMKYVGKAKIRK